MIFGSVAESLRFSRSRFTAAFSPFSKFPKSAARPKLSLEFLAGHHLAWSGDQACQNLNWLTRKFEPNSVLAQFARLNCQLERAKPNGRERKAFFCHSSPSSVRKCSTNCLIQEKENAEDNSLFTRGERETIRQ